jgi:hypothetical protein
MSLEHDSGTIRTNDLPIARELKPWCDVHVVEDLDLVLRAQSLQTKGWQIEVVLELLAEIGVRVGDAELIARSCGKEAIATKATSTNAVMGLVARSANDTCVNNPQPSRAARSTMYCRKT